MRGDAENAAAQPCYMRVDVGGIISARVTVRIRAHLDDVADVFGIAWDPLEEKVEVRGECVFVRFRVGSLEIIGKSVNHFTRVDAGFDAIYADVLSLVERCYAHDLVQRRGCNTIRNGEGHVAEFTSTPTPGETPSIAGDRHYTSATTLAEGFDAVLHAQHGADHVHVEYRLIACRVWHSRVKV